MKKIILFSITLVLSIYVVQGQTRKLEMTLYAISNLYVDKVDKEKLEEDAITALLAALDPHSDYLTKEEVREMNEPLQGNFEGIGIQFNMLTDTLYVAQVIVGGPSQKVGLLAGDRIIEVNDTLIAGVKMKNTDIMKRLRGTKGTTVRVKVLRQRVAELIEFNIVRDKIPIYSMEAAYMLNDSIGYISISRFASSTHEEFVTAFIDLKMQGMKSLILDLQGNGGGYLGTAASLCNEFLSKEQLIVYTEGANQEREDLKATRSGLFETGKLVVLIDETSASASEILSGAIQDWDRGVVIGRRSFGKGLVQRPIPLPDESMLKLTTARYYTPAGRCIQRPYEKGKEEIYYKDLSERYKHGELMHADSIQFPDSLKYSTLINKRTVYGGGGIMPDYFIPLDTSKYTSWHRNIVAKGVLNRVNLNYVDANRDKIKAEYGTFDNYQKRYGTPESLLEDLKKAALADSIPFKEEEYNRSKSLLKLQLKAITARDVFERNEYYIRIINEDNESLSKAVMILTRPEEYDKAIKNNLK